MKSFDLRKNPILKKTFRLIRNIQYRMLPKEMVFTQIYHSNRWGGHESKAGDGSSLKNTMVIRKKLPLLCQELKIRTLLDIPCGDFHWMKEINLPIENYTGADIVDELIKRNQQQYGNSQRTFLRLDITTDDLPESELILCRDGFVHLSNEDILRAIVNIKRSRSKYLLATTFTNDHNNRDIITGQWRPINLRNKPFLFPEPVMIINEDYHSYDNRYNDKSLGLWQITSMSL